MNKIIMFAGLFILVPAGIQASVIKEISPLTDRIIMITYDDGYVIHPVYGQKRSDAIIEVNELNVEAAMKKELYTITSKDDHNYSLKKHPVKIGRKSKPVEFTQIWPPPQPHVNEHYIFLELPKAMKRGKEYQLDVSVAVEGKKSFNFVFDEFENRSEAIHVNHVGYIAGRTAKNSYPVKKYAYVSFWMGDGGPLELEEYQNNLFYVVETKTNQPIWVGKLKKRKDWENGDPETSHVYETPKGQYHAGDVYECEFTACPPAGEVRIVIEGIGSSYKFDLGRDVYRDAFVTTCRGLYLERAGIDKVEPWSRFNHLADHNGAKGYPLYYSAFRAMDLRSEGGNLAEVEKLEKGHIETWGWYHDAGDWDGYPTHMVIPSYLMTAYELAPENFSDGELNIPESGNGIPDILDEASWLLKYFKRTRVLALQKGYATGGVPGARVHGDFFKKPEMKPSWEDDRKWFVFGEESKTSFRYAGQAAQLAYCFIQAGFPDSATVWINEAKEVFTWALENTLPGDDIKSDRFFASVWLYKLTGDTMYHDRVAEDDPVKSERMSLPGDRNYNTWGVYGYSTIKDEMADPELYEKYRNTCIWWADTSNVRPSRSRAFRYGNSWGHPMVVGQATTPKVMPAMVAHAITGKREYLETMIFTADYMLGGNPLNMCWVTGLGDRSPGEILHIDSWLDDVEDPIEGQVVYGPNRPGNRGDNGFNGPWDSDYLRALVYPDEEEWPGHELWSENRWCPITNEYTVHQNICVAAAIYGYLCNSK